MALVVRVFGCEGCGRQFELYQERDELPPTECPFCQQQEVEGPIPATTAVGARTRSKTVDAVYRAHEASSERRAEMAGDPSLKISDMKDNFYGGGMREGDVAAVTPKNPVSDYMQATGMDPWAVSGGVGMESIVAAAKGGETSTGAGIVKSIAKQNFGGGPKVARPSAPMQGKWG